MNKFIDYKSMISEKKEKHSFLIANSDTSDKKGTHWWSILDIELKTDLFFFNSFGVDGLKSFMIQDDKKVVEKNTLSDRTTDKNRQQNNSYKYKI